MKLLPAIATVTILFLNTVACEKPVIEVKIKEQCENKQEMLAAYDQIHRFYRA
jgi:hypothetical protein